MVCLVQDEAWRPVLQEVVDVDVDDTGVVVLDRRHHALSFATHAVADSSWSDTKEGE